MFNKVQNTTLIINCKFWHSVQLQKKMEQRNLLSGVELYKARIGNVQVYQKKY